LQPTPPLQISEVDSLSFLERFREKILKKIPPFPLQFVHFALILNAATCSQWKKNSTDPSTKEKTMKALGLTTLFLCLLAVPALAQPGPHTLWTRTYGASDYDVAYSVQQTADGGYILAGWTASFGAGSNDFYVVKTDGQGDTLWTRTYGGSSDDEAFSVQQTADGSYILAGWTESFGAGSRDFYLVKTNSQGATLWTRTYGGSRDDRAFSVRRASDGGYIVAGYTYSFGVGTPSYANMYLVKTDGQGDTLWTRAYGGSRWEEARCVQPTADGGHIVAGTTNSFGAGTPSYSNFWLIRTNSQGDTLWTRTYGGGSNEYAYSVQQTADGGYIMAGYTQSFGAGSVDFYVVKTNNQGDTLWTRTYGGSSIDWASSVQQTADGGYIVAGYTQSFGAGYYDFYVVKTNGQGDTLWTHTYGGSGDDEAYSVQQTADEGYIVTGYTNSFGAGLYDFYLVRMGPESLLGLVISLSGGNAVLDWWPTGASSYNIYGATTPYATGTQLATGVTGATWTDINTSSRPSPYFYYVTAVSP
jgi:uncharacterized delta-60 repeat protein